MGLPMVSNALGLVVLVLTDVLAADFPFLTATARSKQVSRLTKSVGSGKSTLQ